MLERFKGIFLKIIVYSLLLASIGCLNPFAPIEGETSTRSWTDQRTVGELLHNFALAYDYRDSLRYADCLDQAFTFYYYNIQQARFDSWFRDTDLKATSGMFRNFDSVDLEWNLIPEEVENFTVMDSTLSFIVRFNLTLGAEAPVIGFARFAVRGGRDNKFRVLSWHDDF